MNLLITKSCNRSCPYCFAQKEVTLDSSSCAGNITLPAFYDFLDILEKNFIRNLKLLGGEPTLHPRLDDMVMAALRRNFEVTIFTNGLWGKRVRKFFSKLESDKLHFLVNINEERHSSGREKELLPLSLPIIGSRGQAGFNVFCEDFDLSFLVPLINGHGLKRSIRLGLASPIVGHSNASVAAGDLKKTGTRLIEQMKRLEEQDVLVDFDCGFTYCMFDEDQYQTIVRSTKNGLTSVCDFIGDVDGELNVWPCFPLSNAKHLNLRMYESIDEIRAYYLKSFAQLRQFGSQEECFQCKYLKRGQCCGGCFARTLVDMVAEGDREILTKLGIQR